MPQLMAFSIALMIKILYRGAKQENTNFISLPTAQAMLTLYMYYRSICLCIGLLFVYIQLKILFLKCVYLYILLLLLLQSNIHKPVNKARAYVAKATRSRYSIKYLGMHSYGMDQTVQLRHFRMYTHTYLVMVVQVYRDMRFALRLLDI